jgi:hypothetical protein
MNQWMLLNNNTTHRDCVLELLYGMTSLGLLSLKHQWMFIKDHMLMELDNNPNMKIIKCVEMEIHVHDECRMRME